MMVVPRGLYYIIVTIMVHSTYNNVVLAKIRVFDNRYLHVHRMNAHKKNLIVNGPGDYCSKSKECRDGDPHQR